MWCWETQRFDYASRHVTRRIVRIIRALISCDRVIKEKSWDAVTIKRFIVIHLGEVWLIVVDHSWILGRRITIRMNMDEHGDETMHMHYRPGYKWMWERIKKEGIKRKEEEIFFYTKKRWVFACKVASANIFVLYESASAHWYQELRSCAVNAHHRDNNSNYVAQCYREIVKKGVLYSSYSQKY